MTNAMVSELPSNIYAPLFLSLSLLPLPDCRRSVVAHALLKQRHMFLPLYTHFRLEGVEVKRWRGCTHNY